MSRNNQAVLVVRNLAKKFGDFVAIDNISFAVGPLTWILPLSHVFEGMRYSLKTGQFDFNQFMTASLLNLIYFSLSIIFFAWIFNMVKKNGRLVKLN